MSKAKSARRATRASASSSNEKLALRLLWARKGLIAFILFVLPILIYLGNTEYGYTKSIFALISISGLAVLWFVEMWVRGSYRVKLTQLFWPGVALCGAGALSMLGVFFYNGNINYSVMSLNLMLYFGLFYLILANSIENERDARLFLGCLLAAAVSASVYGLLQYYAFLPGPGGVTGGKDALISFMGNRNYLASFLGHLFPVAIAFFVFARPGLLDRVLQIATLLVLGVCVWALVLINSTAIWLGFVLSALFFVVCAISIWLVRTLSPAHVRWLISIVAIVFIAATAYLAVGVVQTANGTASENNPVKRAFSYIVKLWESNSGEIRSLDWWIGLEMWKASPFFGQGIGNYKLKFFQYKIEFAKTEMGKKYDFFIRRAAQAHNEYVQVAAEMGTIGLIAMLTFIITIFWTTLRAAWSAPDSRTRWLLLAALASLVVFMVDAMVSFPLHLPASALNLVFLLGLLQSKWLRSELSFAELSLRAIRPWAVAVSLLALVVVVLATRDWVADTCLQAGQKALNKKQISLPEIQRDLKDCSLENDFQPGDVLAELGVLYERASKQSNLSTAQRDDYLQKSLDFYIKSKSVKPVEQVYLQIALLYRALASDEKEAGHSDKASQALEASKKYLEQLLELQPDETLRLEALYALQVLLPIANDKSEDETLPRVEAFLKDHPDSELAYLTRAEIFHNRVLNGQTDWCDQTKADYDHALQLINKQLDQANRQAQLGELDPHGPQILYETFVPFLMQEKEVAERQLKALKC